jgi:hypothetical protein
LAKGKSFIKRRQIILSGDWKKRLKKSEGSIAAATLDKKVRENRFRERKKATARQMQHHFVMPQSLAALDQAEIPDHAIVAAAHPSQPSIFESPHRASMHQGRNPSNLGFNSRGCDRLLALPFIDGAPTHTQSASIEPGDTAL